MDGQGDEDSVGLGNQGEDRWKKLQVKGDAALEQRHYLHSSAQRRRFEC